MINLYRREFLAGTAALAASAVLLATRKARAGDASFMNNVPDPLLSGKDLPTFKFALERSKGKVIGNSFGKEATVEQLPISKGIAGVSMQIEPDGFVVWILVGGCRLKHTLRTGACNVRIWKRRGAQWS